MILEAFVDRSILMAKAVVQSNSFEVLVQLRFSG